MVYSVASCVADWRGLLPALAVAALSLPAAAAPPARQLHDFEASGPVRLAADQVVSVCATNYGRDMESVLLAVVDASPAANPAGVLTAQQAQLAPYASACVYLPGANWQQLGPQASVVGLVVDNGFVDQGVIRQGIGTGGGGCIVSMQVLEALTGKPAVFLPMRRHLIP